MITAPTWIIHAVYPDETDITIGDTFGNIHTHGLAEYGHKELCIPFGINAHLAAALLNNIGMLIANKGFTLNEGLVSGLLENDFELKVVSYDNDPTLYILLPDPDNRFADDPDCETEFAKQELYAKHIHDNKDYV